MKQKYPISSIVVKRLLSVFSQSFDDVRRSPIPLCSVVVSEIFFTEVIGKTNRFS